MNISEESLADCRYGYMVILLGAYQVFDEVYD